MLRIGLPQSPTAPNPSTPAPAPMNPGMTDTPGPARSDKEPKFSADKVPQSNAGYMGPERGPFKCGNCEFFDPTDSDCHVVAGKVDAEGCCNMFTPIGSMDAKSAEEDAESPSEEKAESLSGAEEAEPIESSGH